MCVRIARRCTYRRYAVLADAGVGEEIGVAVIGEGGHGGYVRLLEADERTLGLLVLAPLVPVGLSDSLRVDVIRV